MAEESAVLKPLGEIDIHEVVAWVKKRYGGADYHSAPFQSRREWILEFAASEGKVFNNVAVPYAAAQLIQARKALYAMPEADRYVVAELMLRLEETLQAAAAYSPVVKMCVHALPPFEWPELAAPQAQHPSTIH